MTDYKPRVVRDSHALKYYMPKRVANWTRVAGAFSYNEKRNMRWLQKVCLWILEKLHCHYTQELVSYTTIAVHADTVMELISKQARALEAQTGRRPRYVIVGREQEMQLFNENFNRMLCVNLTMPGVPRQVMGMTLVVAPWFDGVVCLTELE